MICVHACTKGCAAFFDGFIRRLMKALRFDELLLAEQMVLRACGSVGCADIQLNDRDWHTQQKKKSSSIKASKQSKVTKRTICRHYSACAPAIKVVYMACRAAKCSYWSPLTKEIILFVFFLMQPALDLLRSCAFVVVGHHRQGVRYIG